MILQAESLRVLAPHTHTNANSKGNELPITDTHTNASPLAFYHDGSNFCSSDERLALTHAKLDAMGISYSTERHAAANKLEDLLVVLAGHPGTPCKNLFIKVCTTN